MQGLELLVGLALAAILDLGEVLGDQVRGGVAQGCQATPGTDPLATGKIDPLGMFGSGPGGNASSTQQDRQISTRSVRALDETYSEGERSR